MLGLRLCELEERHEGFSIICDDQTIQQLIPNYAPAWYQKSLMLQNYNNNGNKAAKADKLFENFSKR